MLLSPNRCRIAARTFLPALALALVSVAALGRWAQAHQNSMAFATIEVAEDRSEAAIHLKLDPPDIAEILGLEADARPTEKDVLRGQNKLFEFVTTRIEIQSGTEVCTGEIDGQRFATLTSDDPPYVELSWKAGCKTPIYTLAVEYDLFFDIDPAHQCILRAVHGGDVAQPMLNKENARFVWQLGEPPPQSGLDFVGSGVEHIVYGFDHIAFLLGLLLLVVIIRPRGDNQASWRVRSIGPALKYTAGIVTSFTVAHSITLIAASLDVVSLPSRLVESLIALSIVYIAVENVVKPDTRARHLVTFSFGLIHGLGFASMLKVLLPPTDVVWPLLMFNVGVEVGQLAIVICMLPLLHAAVRWVGAARYRTLVLGTGSGILAILGLLWLIERAFEVTILGL